MSRTWRWVLNKSAPGLKGCGGICSVWSAWRAPETPPPLELTPATGPAGAFDRHPSLRIRRQGAVHCSYSPTSSSYSVSLHLTTVQFLSCVRSSLHFILFHLTPQRLRPLNALHAHANTPLLWPCISDRRPRTANPQSCTQSLLLIVSLKASSLTPPVPQRI